MAVIKPLADKKQHTIELTLPRRLYGGGVATRSARQVFINLLENAVKYTPDHGRISMTLRRAQGRSSPSRAMIEVVVADSGIGIPEADRLRVFERFYRVDKACSRELGEPAWDWRLSNTLWRPIAGWCG